MDNEIGYVPTDIQINRNKSFNPIKNRENRRFKIISALGVLGLALMACITGGDWNSNPTSGAVDNQAKAAQATEDAFQESIEATRKAILASDGSIDLNSGPVRPFPTSTARPDGVGGQLNQIHIDADNQQELNEEWGDIDYTSPDPTATPFGK